jgi:hypothetical protein
MVLRLISIKVKIFLKNNLKVTSSEVETTQDKNFLREIDKVKRETEVLAIGDLGGNLDILLESLKNLNVIKINDSEAEVKSYDDLFEKINWSGGKKKLVFAGDILGDRYEFSLPCLVLIDKLSKQAEKEGGEISILAGNHDSFIMSFSF